MTSPSVMRHPSAFLPIVMSLAALTAVALHIARAGTTPQPDEGAAAHTWQLLMVLQVPLIAFFAVTWLPRAPRQALPVLALQIVAAIAAMVPVFILHW